MHAVENAAMADNLGILGLRLTCRKVQPIFCSPIKRAARKRHRGEDCLDVRRKVHCIELFGHLALTVTR
jgi:hypothetical protein